MLQVSCQYAIHDSHCHLSLTLEGCDHTSEDVARVDPPCRPGTGTIFDRPGRRTRQTRPETATSFPGNPRIGVPWGASQGIEEGKL